MSYTDILRMYAGSPINFTTSPIAISPTSGVYAITYTLLDSGNVSTITYNGSGTYYAGSDQATDIQTLSTPQQDAITAILNPTSDYSVMFSDVANLTFSSGANGAIAIGQDTNSHTEFFDPANPTVPDNFIAGGTFEYENGYSVAQDGDVWLNSSLTGGWGTVLSGSEQFLDILHELGHAMGLTHPTVSGEDTQKYTVMASDPADVNPDVSSGVYATGLQLYDVLALQSIYGMNWATRQGDTVYSVADGFGATLSKAFTYTIWDGGGTDVIDATGYGSAEIDLRQGHFSSIGLQSDSGAAIVFDTPASGGVDEYDAGNVAVAYYAIIENAIGTSGNDTLIGNAWNNVLSGGGGNDTIYGDGITYDGVAGNIASDPIKDSTGTAYDWGPGGTAPAANLSGDDILIGGAGNDLFYGGLGNDVIHGGYVAADITGVVSGWDPAGEFTGTNNAAGIALSDIAYASDGLDSVDYSKLPDGTDPGTGIDVTFSVGTGVDLASVEKGYGDEYGIDALFSIEFITGTPWNDKFEGTAYSADIVASGGADQYLYSSDAGSGGTIYYYPLLDPQSGGHIVVTVSSTGGTGTVEKLISGGSLGEDTIGTGIHTFIGTSGDDTFNGMLPGSFVIYSGGSGNDAYNFNMNDLDAGPTTATANVLEVSDGSLADVAVTNFDSEAFINFDEISSVNSINIDYYKWNAALGVNDTLHLSFSQSNPAAIQTITLGSLTYEFGTPNSETFTAASGAHLFFGGAGTDTVDYSAATGGVTADLSTGNVSNNGWGYTDTLHDIANVIGSSHNDSITGDSGANVLTGGAGNDTIVGGAGDDTLIGGAGNDSLDGGSGTNTVDFSASAGGETVYLATGSATGDGTDTLTNIQNVKGTSHSDIIAGNSGDNILDGGAGFDTVDYQFSSSGVTVNLPTGTATGDGNDTLLNIEAAEGSNYNDTLIGSGSGSILYGLAGNDTLENGIAHYGKDTSGVTINLVTGTATDGWGDTDTLVNIHYVVGSSHSDTIIADASTVNIFGDLGNDTYVFSSGFGNTNISTDPSHPTSDTIHFTGVDPSHIRMYTNSSGNLYLVDTTNPSFQISVASSVVSGTNESIVGQSIAQVTFDDVNNTVWSLTGGLTLTGTTSAESLYGTAYGDVINGMGGADTIFGNGGNDTISSGSGDDILDGGAGTDTLTYAGASAAVTVNLATTSAQNTIGAGTDTITNFENLTGSGFNDTLTGDANANVIDGGAGNDIMDGAAGTDTLSYASATAGITISLAITTGQATGGSGTDTISNFENLTGSAFGDTLTGDANANTISGGAGNDIIAGRGGADILDGGAGTDTVDYSAAAAGVTVNLTTGTASNDGDGSSDTLTNFENITGSAFNDTLTGDANANTISGGAGNDIIAGRGGADVLDGGAGTDTVDYSAAAAGATVNLATGTASNDGDGSSDTLTNFENITGSAFDDNLTGDGNANVIDGGAGNDTIQGGAGNDTLTGGTGTDTLTYAAATAGVTVNLATATAQNTVGAGTDTISGFENLTGSAFADTLTGDANANVIDGGAGNDVMNGAGGIDTLSYASATAAITISLAITTGQVTGGSGTDTISNFENLTGSAFNDTLTGDANANTIDGGAGNDIIQGGAGDDILIGGAGTDTLTYAAAASGVTVNLALTSAQVTGGAGTDTISGFENLTGSAFADTLTGDANANTISGGAGNDIIAGRGGADVLDGGTGTDTVDYSAAVAGVIVNLATGTASNDGDGSSDTLTNFENITGSAFDDNLTGDDNANVIDGGAGNDIIQGRLGNDVLTGGSGIDTVTYSAASGGVTVNLATTTAQNTVSAGTDTISGFENLTGSAFADTLTGDGNNNVIEGLAGNDVMVGGLGTDTVSYEHAASAVTVSLATTSAQSTVGAGTDTISGFENLTGSAFNDTLTGDGNANVLQGLAGNDLLSGGAGNDTLDGGSGTDTATFASAAAGVTVDLSAGTATGDGTDTLISIENVTGSTHNDTIISNSSDNVLNGGTGTDTVSYAPAASHVTVNLSTGTATGDGNDTLSNFENVIGSAFDDTITGDTNVNTLTGGAGNDTITGGGGADLLYGGTGSDTFLFLAAHALSAIVKIEDFTSGSGNDKIDLKDVISSYDPATMAITDWVQITTSGSDSILKVDIDGTGSAHTWQQIATIVGVTGLTDEAALVASGNLIAH